MSDDRVVTVATFTDPVTAALARSRLEEVGIRTVLNNEETAVIGWQLTNSPGGVQLLVAGRDVEAAVDQHHRSDKT